MMNRKASHISDLSKVLFNDAMCHVGKICRIITSTPGHPLLVGVGGSGRQSLSRLSSYTCLYQTMMIVISDSVLEEVSMCSAKEAELKVNMRNKHLMNLAMTFNLVLVAFNSYNLVKL